MLLVVRFQRRLVAIARLVVVHIVALVPVVLGHIVDCRLVGRQVALVVLLEHIAVVLVVELCLQRDMVVVVQLHMDHPNPTLLAIPMASDSLQLMLGLLLGPVVLLGRVVLVLGILGLLLVVLLTQQLVDRLVEPVGILVGRLVDKLVV